MYIELIELVVFGFLCLAGGVGIGVAICSWAYISHEVKEDESIHID